MAACRPAHCESRHSIEGTAGTARIISAFGAGDSHAAAVYGEPHDGTLVRIHSRCLYSEVFASTECDCGWQLRRSRELLAPGGVLVYLDQEGRGHGLRVKAEAHRLARFSGLDTYEAFGKLGYPADARSYTEAADLLKLLGLTWVRLLTNNPAKIDALQEAGIKVTRVPLIPPDTGKLAAYLGAKKRRGHLL